MPVNTNSTPLLNELSTNFSLDGGMRSVVWSNNNCQYCTADWDRMDYGGGLISKILTFWGLNRLAEHL
jgi:hypothetical protein